MCENLATHRYTWPGSDEQIICDEHLPKLKSVACAMGFHLQIIPLSKEDIRIGMECSQKVSPKSSK